jgi:hypothetical protein
MPVSRLWLLATVPLFGAGVVAIVKLAVGLVRSTREAVVVSLPVVPQQSFVLPAADRYAVFAEGKLGERGLADLRYAVTADADGRELRMSPVLVRSHATSLDGTVRLELFSFAATAGRHTLRVVGIDAGRDYRQNRIVIARQRRAQMALRIVGLVAAGIVTIGCLVGSSLLIAGPR